MGRRFTAAELAEALGGVLEGDPQRVLTGLCDVREASPRDLSFVANPRYRRFLGESQAGLVLVEPQLPVPEGRDVIRVGNPYAAFARAVALFHPRSWPAAHIDPRAAIADDAVVADGVCIEPFVVVRPGAVIGPGAWLQAHAYVGAGAVVGANSRLMPGAVVMDGCSLGQGVWLNPGAVVGGEGFGFAPTRQGLLKIPQVGAVQVQDGVELGANSCVDRGALSDTVVGRGAKLDNLCQVGHGARVGAHSVMVAYSGVAGSSTLGPGVTLAARSSVLGHIELGAGARVAAHSMVAQSQPAGASIAGVPTMPHRQWLRASRAAEELPELLREVRRLQQRIQALEQGQQEDQGQ